MKLGVASLLDKLGFFSALRSFRSTRSGIVLTVHRVLPPEELRKCYESQIALTDTVFEALILLLLREYRIVPLRQLLEHPESFDGRQRVALTFDDGWEDTYSVAYPIMLRYQIPATVFLCTGLLTGRQMIPEERFARLWRHCRQRGDLASLQVDLEKWGTTAHSASRQIWGRKLKQLPLDAKLLMLTHLEDKYAVLHDDERRFITWEQARIMAANGISFGSHTVRHSTLTAEHQATMLDELTSSRRAIQTQLQTTCDILAYPNGCFDRRVIEAAREARYTHALTTEHGFVERRSNPLAIPRICVSNPVLTGNPKTLHAARTRLHLQRFPFQFAHSENDWSINPDAHPA